jgi:hypothetical protein
MSLRCRTWRGTDAAVQTVYGEDAGNLKLNYSVDGSGYFVCGMAATKGASTGSGRLAQVKRGEGEREATVELALITDGSGAGRGGGKQADALPPLMPGLPARRGGSQQ